VAQQKHRKIQKHNNCYISRFVWYQQMFINIATASAACVARLGAVIDWWRSWLMGNMLVFMSMVDILNLTCNYQFVFAVLDAVGNILRVHYKSMKCNTSFSQCSKSTLIIIIIIILIIIIRKFITRICSQALSMNRRRMCMCKNYKNQMSFSRVMITNVLPRFLWTTVYIILYWMMQGLMKHNSRQKDISTVIQQNMSNRRSINRIPNWKMCQKIWHYYHCFTDDSMVSQSLPVPVVGILSPPVPKEDLSR